MTKSKAPTPHESIRAREEREEQEKIALLPPGLLNHGNTCFMNSVLQGLIATQLLSDLALFKPISPSIHRKYNVVSRKSPLLTNGHNLGGQYEQSPVNSMPVGDDFLDLMVKAWDSQMHQKRENLSPKAILVALGRKYDQYLDFAQQDAHEFLRILLDASRMEELDEIKKRQPPPEKVKKQRRTTITPRCSSSQSSTVPPTIPEEEKLETLSDMIFGGKFASILVCRECKHVSTTYEDFNDISLSIKAEDYHARKRDRLKNFAKRLTSFQTSSVGAIKEIPRPLSVPPSPRHSAGHEEPMSVSEPRRRSFDVISDTSGDQDSDTNATVPKDGNVASHEFAANLKLSEISSSVKPEKSDKKDKGDGWSRIGRRIGLTVGMGKWDRNNKELHRPPEAPPMESAESKASTSASEDVPIVDVVSPSPTVADREDGFLLISRTSSPRPATPPSRNNVPLPHLHKPRASYPKRSKTPKPPKPTTAELNYLREILADVTPSSSNNPFSFLKPPYQNQGIRSVLAPGSPPNLWLSVNHFSGIEECLRMFTSVEILDGENMVGCRRCWKIANGEHEKPSAEGEGTDDEDSDDAEQDSVNIDPPVAIQNRRPKSPPIDSMPLRPAALTNIPISISTPTVSLHTHLDPSEYPIIPSLPTTAPSSIHEFNVNVLSSVEDPPSIPILSPLIPSISTAGSDSYIIQPPVVRSSSPVDDTSTIAHPVPRLGQVLNHLPPCAPQCNSLSISELSHESDGDESSGAESDTSISTSMQSMESISGSNAPRAVTPMRKKPKPVIMRPAYKRYLIGTPPPVLVIHLKRFQQIHRTHILFSHGIKKLDDFVAFPEFLDLAPYIAPRKEDFGLGRKGKAHSGVGMGSSLGKHPSKSEKYMYRLYAVIVHIGNMLGGHYIAYTALPEAKSTTENPEEQNASGPSAEVKVPRQWAYISDTVVRLTTLEEVLKAKAYICMYERIEA
ncbi:putative ubiquitin carboxyl-terminal hydrolase 7 [Termitomyces sp. J132]|nr:hypothetical protein H2248_011656 [Termitomyces sp. 'cryptogamus']KNZ73563.1 putative ubiquitin carboxyl-terminal hydrolase 7 [Termitomyces sp. J132]